MKIFYNSSCSKSRNALEILQSEGIEPEIIDYIKNPLTEETLKKLLTDLKLNAEDITRKKESIFQNEYSNKELNEEDYIQILVKHPSLMERPIISKEGKAVIARTPEAVREILV